MSNLLQPVCVYCASSTGADPVHMEVARRLGELLADHRYPVVYGGSRMGTMGALAEGALSRAGHVLGILPGFLERLEIAHESLSELRLVEDMRARKHAMLNNSSAVIALPGGCGTFEELLEAITLRKLGVHSHPIVIVNTHGFYDAFLALMASAEQEGFLSPGLGLYIVVDTPEAAVAVIAAQLP